MKKICVNKKKLVLTVGIAITAAATATAVLVPKAVKNAKRSKYACV